MLEVRKNTFSRNYENSFFREFSRHLVNSFKEKNLTGVLIGSPLCEVDERLQIDALLITECVVCIIDFKNFKGKVKLPAEKDFEFGLWTTETGEQIKGGSSINPFIQLKNQKRRFVEVSNKHIQKQLAAGDAFNPFHLIRAVCFQGEIELTGKIPSNEELNFFILNKTNFVEGILDIVDVTDKDVTLSTNSFDAFKTVFRADQFKVDENTSEDKLKVIASKSTNLDYSKLYDDQRAALTEIESFLENPDQQIFILQGTINSGKSFLTPFIQEIAYSKAIQETEIFAASSRVAKNLLSSSGMENINSIYSFIYGGHKTEKVEEGKEDVQREFLNDNEELEVPDELSLENVPLKKCDNSGNALFIVDESQLVSDSYHQSIDLVFGTGCLLKDFLTFTDIASSNRKIVFIGDPYQLLFGKTEESPLNPKYLEEAYKLKVSCFQLLDKENFSDINKQALSCVRSIKSKFFNSLRFIESEQISLLNKDDITPYVTNMIKNNSDGHILAFSNEESQKVNLWIKKAIIKTGEEIATRDLVLFNNNISVDDENDPFAQPKKIYNGQFATVVSVSATPFTESVKIKETQTVLSFREICLQLNESGSQIKVLSLENFRINVKADLSKNEIIAFKVLLSTQLNKHIHENPFEKSSEYMEAVSSNVCQTIQKEINELKNKLEVGEKVKLKLEEKEIELRKLLKAAKRKHKFRIESSLRKDPSTKYYKYKNAALLRFGWAMTVHKSMSYKWEEVLFNVDPGELVGKTNENHFRWLYTGLSRARHKVILINYKSISPFDNTIFHDGNAGVRPPDIFFHSNNENPNLRLEEFENFVLAKISKVQYTIQNIEHFNWQERYFFKNENNQEAIISFSYNGQGNFKLPSIVGGDNNLSASVMEILKIRTALSSFDAIAPIWRRLEYEKLKVALNQFGINFEFILQTNYKDKIRFFSNDNELDIELDYCGDGMVSFITAKYYQNISIWEQFQTAIEQIK